MPSGPLWSRAWLQTGPGVSRVCSGMRVSATMRSQSARKRFCPDRLSKLRPLSAFSCPYLIPDSILPLREWASLAGFHCPLTALFSSNGLEHRLGDTLPDEKSSSTRAKNMIRPKLWPLTDPCATEMPRHLRANGRRRLPDPNPAIQHTDFGYVLAKLLDPPRATQFMETAGMGKKGARGRGSTTLPASLAPQRQSYELRKRANKKGQR